MLRVSVPDLAEEKVPDDDLRAAVEDDLRDGDKYFEDGDWHNPTPELQYHEIVDLETGRRLPDGERGALAVTHLDRRGTVLIRFVVSRFASTTAAAPEERGQMSLRLNGQAMRGEFMTSATLISPLRCAYGLPSASQRAPPSVRPSLRRYSLSRASLTA